jgi:DNA-binding MarR family transcriptional regulator
MNKNESERLKMICGKVAEGCMGMRMRNAARVVGNFYDGHLKPSGLKATQFTLLNAICLNPSFSIGRLANFLQIDRTTLNRNLKPLERKGLIQSVAGRDPRTRTLNLTAAGTRTLKQALPLWLEAQSAVVGLLDKHVETFADDLHTLEKLGT